MKKFIALMLCLVILCMTTITVYANSIQPCSNNVNSAEVSFNITTSGKATVTCRYYGKSGVTQSAEIETKVQKKFGLIWITVDNGSWTDTSTATNFSKSHSVQLSKAGTYRAHVEFKISGTGGSDDKITKNVERTYG